MLGAITGDIVGSVYEGAPIKTCDFPFFHGSCHITDDTLLTVAVAEHLLTERDLVDLFHEMVHLYPAAGFGLHFFGWAYQGHRDPYHSYGNGSAMRVSPAGFAATTLEEALALAERTAAVTHDHPEGIKGAKATAAAVYLARNGESKEGIRRIVSELSGYDLSRTLEEIRPAYEFEISCQRSVPESILAFLEANSFEEAIRNAVSLGGDADTMACIAGGIAEAFYGEVPLEMRQITWSLLDDRLRPVVRDFYERFELGEI